MMKRYAWVVVLAVVMAGAASVTSPATASAAPAAAVAMEDCGDIPNVVSLWDTYNFVQSEEPEYNANEVKAQALTVFQGAQLVFNCGSEVAGQISGTYLVWCEPWSNEPWTNWDCMINVLWSFPYGN